MILWDIASGERLRTFEGHDRGLACIEFKVCFFNFNAPLKKEEKKTIFPNLFIYCFRTISSYLVLMTARSRFGVQQRGNAFERWWDMMPLFERCRLIPRLDVL